MVVAMNWTILFCGKTSLARRSTRLSSVPTSQRVPSGASLIVLTMCSVEPTVSDGGADLETAFGMGDHQTVRVFGAEGVDVRLPEHLVHRAVALPEEDARLPDLVDREAAHFQVGIPDDHLVHRETQLVAGPPAEVLVGEEQHLGAALESPPGDGAGVGRGAYDAAVLAAEGLEVGGGVDVGDRRHLVLGIEDFVQLAPATLDLGQVGHVGHRAAGREVGQDGDLVRRGHDVGDLGHEMNAAEDHVFRVGLRREARQFQRVAGQVGVLVDIGALVVMAEDDGLLAQPGAGGADALMAVRVGEVVEAVEMYRGGGHGSRETLNWRQESAVMKRSVGRDSISLPLRPRTEIARKRWLRIRRSCTNLVRQFQCCTSLVH